MIGYAHKTCDCEDFPCCGHNDVDPNYEPDPYERTDYYDEYDDAVTMCSMCDGDAMPRGDEPPLCSDCL